LVVSPVYRALSEEIIFRGLLLRIFIQKHVVCRGIFLVGVVGAAFHFFGTHILALLTLVYFND